MTVKEIVIKYLKDNGYGGLVDDDNECGCDLGNLMLCGDPENCKPAYKIECINRSRCSSDYCVSENKNDICRLKME